MSADGILIPHLTASPDRCMPYKPSMQKVLLVLTFLWWTVSNLFGQKNPTKIYGTVPIDNVSSMDATEVTINEWIHFIINSNFTSQK